MTPQHTGCGGYRACPACRRNDDTFDTLVCGLCALIVLTVCPVIPLLVMAGHGIGGTAGAWTVIGSLLALPFLAAGIHWARFRSPEESW